MTLMLRPTIHDSLGMKIWAFIAFWCFGSSVIADNFDFSTLELDRGVVCGIGLSETELLSLIEETANRDWTVLFQTEDTDLLVLSKDLAGEKRILGTRFYTAYGTPERIQLADNVADRIVVGTRASHRLTDDQTMRPLCPGGTACVDGEKKTKNRPIGIDDWSHPYHGPDNNPQSNDQHVKGNFRTQFLGYPMFSPMPEQTVIANGKIYKAMGHLAHKQNQNEMLNTLLCINAYNGTILWDRELPEGFMIHRNTMIATDDGLLLGDDTSCKIIDGSTGKIERELKINENLSDGPVWKWMAKDQGVLYALVGNQEVKVETQRSSRRGLGHWPWDMWKGHDYDNPETSFGFGRTLLAIDLESGKVLWAHRSLEFFDARAVCMNDREIFCYSPNCCLTAIDRKTGQIRWRNESEDLLHAIGENQKAQFYITGYSTTSYMKCSAEHVFFAGPQRERTVVASADDGHLEWTYPLGNLQLVLRRDGIWAAGPQQSENGVMLDYKTGEVLSTFPARRACTRATGCVDSIFFRANGGTVRVLTDNSTAQHFDPMRPPCQDGVLIAGGHLYWGPWMCGCQLSLYGNIGLRPQPGNTYRSAESALLRHNQSPEVMDDDSAQLGDWTTYRGSTARDDRSLIPIPKKIEVAWQKEICSGILPTAASTANGNIFVADRRGVIQAFDQAGDKLWTQTTDGPIYYAPTYADGRLFVGSADGKVHAFAAASGERLWSYRVGPNVDRIPVFGALITSWPVSGGIAHRDGIVYAAAGLTHYDGTHIVALDAATGLMKAENRDSGVLQAEVNNGISVQGELKIIDNELRFLAGGVYETARYDLKTLRCLNTPQKQVDSQYRTAFYPYYPSYGKYISLDYQCQDGCELSHDASYEGSQFVNLGLYPKRPPNVPKVAKEEARWVRRGGKTPAPIWQDQSNRRFTCFAATDSTLLAGGHIDGDTSSGFIAAIDTHSGEDIWLAPLTCPPVKGGVSLGHDGTILVVLEDGRLISLQSTATDQ